MGSQYGAWARQRRLGNQQLRAMDRERLAPCAEGCGRTVGTDGYAGRCKDCAIRIQNEQQEG